MWCHQTSPLKLPQNLGSLFCLHLSHNILATRGVFFSNTNRSADLELFTRWSSRSNWRITFAVSFAIFVRHRARDCEHQLFAGKFTQHPQRLDRVRKKSGDWNRGQSFYALVQYQYWVTVVVMALGWIDLDLGAPWLVGCYSSYLQPMQDSRILKFRVNPTAITMVTLYWARN